MKVADLADDIAIKELVMLHGGDGEHAVQMHRAVQAIWNLPVEERQGAYDALKARYPGGDFAISGPGIRSDEA